MWGKRNDLKPPPPTNKHKHLELAKAKAKRLVEQGIEPNLGPQCHNGGVPGAWGVLTPFEKFEWKAFKIVPLPTFKSI